jgi:tRNA A-37 threonylcarbamoyl transferase component Bud32
MLGIEYQQALQSALALPQRVTAIIVAGETLWVKKACTHKMNWWHHAQKYVAKLLRFQALRPTVSKGGSAGLKIEAARLEKFRAAGFAVPVVEAIADDYIVLHDLGQILDLELRADATHVRRVVKDAAHKIATLHGAGLAHGRARLNDMVRLKNGDIGFIDFEEDIDSADIDLAVLQARDVFLFAVSVAKFARHDADICTHAFQSYFAQNSDERIKTELRGFLKVLRPFAIVIGNNGHKLGKDIICACCATNALSAILLAK